MKIGAHILELALAGALACVTVPLHAAELASPAKLKPMQAVSLDQGDKHIVGYFISEGGMCKVTLMISDTSEASDEVPVVKPSRVTVGIASGKSASIDTADAKSTRLKSLSLRCEKDALSMSVVGSVRTAFDSRS